MKIDKYSLQLIKEEIRGCFDFFWNESNAVDNAAGYGLTLDKTGGDQSSLAAVGFALAAYVIGVERGYITFEQGYDRVLKTFSTLEKVDKYEGFYVHFVDQKTVVNSRNSEHSSIDTAILLMGAITAGEYFGSEIRTLANQMASSVNWEHFVMDYNNKKVFRMAHNSVKYKENNGWGKGIWHNFAEHMCRYNI